MTLDWPASGLVLPELARDPRGANEASLSEALSSAFFVRFTAVREARLPSTATPAMGVRITDSEATGDSLVLVHPIARRPGIEHHPFVSIGRTGNNDICIGDEGISKFHAYVKVVDRTFLLQDARSRNGTTVDGLAAPGRGLGSPLELRTGQSVRFGGVDAVFLDAAALHQLIVRLTSRPL